MAAFVGKEPSVRLTRTTAMLVVLYAVAFVAAFNENIVNVALVDIMGAFDITATTAQWLVTGYMMVTTVIVAISAYLYRRVGLRRLFLTGVGFLAAGSVAATFAPTFPLLLAFRLVQAVGTGIFIPAMMTTVLIVAPRRRLGLFLSVGGMMITFGPAFGPVVSGLMVTLVGWRAMFLPTLGLILLIGACGLFLVRDTAGTVSLRLDLPSVMLITVGMVGLVLGLSQLTTRPLPAIGCTLGGFLVLAGFVHRQGRIDNPVLSFRPMASSRFWPSVVLVVVAMMTTFSLSVLLPLYFQGSFTMTALMAGVLLLMPILVNAATAILGGRVVDAHGPWPLLPLGFLIIAAGQLMMLVVAQRLSWLGVLAAAAVVFGGVGLVLSSSQATGLSTLTGPQRPHGVALLNTFIQVAASIGPSLLIGVFSSRAQTSAQMGATRAQANADGFARAITVGACITLVGAGVALWYSRRLANSGSTVLASDEPSGS